MLAAGRVSSNVDSDPVCGYRAVVFYPGCTVVDDGIQTVGCGVAFFAGGRFGDLGDAAVISLAISASRHAVD